MINGVLAERTGRGDLLLLRGITNRWAVKWERDTGQGFYPVDLTDYTCTFEMRLASSDTVVYSRPCVAHGVDGVAAVYIPPEAFNDPVWLTRPTGEWRLTATRDGVTELLGAGHWHLS